MAKWLIVLVAALYLAALVLSRRRPRMTVIIGVLLGANALLVTGALDVRRQLFIDQLSGTVFGPAASVFYATLLAYLVGGWQVIWWLGVILVATGGFAGSNASGTAVRTWVSGGLETAGAAMADGPVGGAGRWTTSNARWLRVAVGVLGTVVLLWGIDVSLSRLFWSLVLTVVLLGVVQVWSARAASLPPTASQQPAWGCYRRSIGAPLRAPSLIAHGVRKSARRSGSFEPQRRRRQRR